MRYLPGKSSTAQLFHKVLLTLTLAVSYFSENSTLTSASSFETSGKKKLQRRLPANMSQQTFEFNCLKPHDFIEMSTQFETIRLVAKNCPQKPELFSSKLKQKLLTFETSPQLFSSEYAYLSEGENAFEIRRGDKSYKILIIRY